MSQTPHDLERGSNAAPNLNPSPNRSSQGEPSSGFGDSSGPFFSIYSKAAEEEDNKMVESWQKDADGILIFTGLFSAAVAALLGLTVPDLRPSSQDTSAFYLGNIYEVLADPNTTRTSIPSPAVKPPLFSPPRHAVWVNSLWFSSLVISVSCALLATSLQQWARRYIRLAQPARRTPEKRARMRAFYANGVDKMHIPWAVEGLPTLLHLSLFLFFGGLAIFLFNVDQEVFTCVVCWIGLFLMVYGLITLLPLIRHESPYYSPLSKPAWVLYAGIHYVTLKALAFITSHRWLSSRQAYERFLDKKNRYHGWMLGGLEKKAEETASERSSEIDIRILGWIISALGDDDSLEKFFEAIPGLFNSKLVKDLERDFPEALLGTFWSALDGFMGRTLSSNSVTDSVKSHRDIICGDIRNMIPCPFETRYKILHRILGNPAQLTFDRVRTMAKWRTHENHDIADRARKDVTLFIPRLGNNAGDWISFARDVCGLALQDNLSHGRDNVLLSTLIDTCRRGVGKRDVICVELLAERLIEQTNKSEFDIRRTLPGLQRGFCGLWNEFVQQARFRGWTSPPDLVIRTIRPLYIALHQGTDAAPTEFCLLESSYDLLPSSYPLCNISTHLPDSAVYIPESDSRSVPNPRSITNSRAAPVPSQPGGQPAVSRYPPSNGGPLNSKTTGKTKVSYAAIRDSLLLASLPVPPFLEGATQRDAVAPSTKPNPDISKNCSTKPTPTPSTPVPMSESAPTVLNKSLASQSAGSASTPNSLLLALSVLNSIPASPPPSHAPTSPDAESLALFSSTTPSRPNENTTLPRPHARGLVNTRNMCFANAVLQLLVHSPSVWNLFRELGDLKGQRKAGGPNNGGGATPVTPLVDATVRFFEEFMSRGKVPPPAQQSTQQTATREDGEEKNKFLAFEPTYIYDAMKGKKQLKKLLDGKDQDADEFLGFYLDALDEELIELNDYINTRKILNIEEPGEGEDQTDVRKRGCSAGLFESPISRIFGGRSLSTVRAPNQPDTITIEDWRLLRLNIQPDSVCTIQDALTHLSQRQPVQVGQSSSNNATQQVLLEALPPTLVLHLERFQYDAATDSTKKISKPVQFTPELEIPLEIMVPVTGKSVEPVRYKLHGVLYHHGESAGSGHYTVDVLHQNGDEGIGEAWLHIDDEAVSAVRHADVFGGHDNSRVDDSCAYMLFYCRTDSTWT